MPDYPSQSNQYTDTVREDWRTCPHTTIVKKTKQLRGSGGAFYVWRCDRCNMEFTPKLNKQ